MLMKRIDILCGMVTDAQVLRSACWAEVFYDLLDDLRANPAPFDEVKIVDAFHALGSDVCHVALLLRDAS